MFYEERKVVGSSSNTVANDARTCVAPQKKVTRKAFFFRSCYFSLFRYFSLFHEITLYNVI